MNEVQEKETKRSISINCANMRKHKHVIRMIDRLSRTINNRNT